MTVSSSTNRVSYVGNGTTVDFAVPFYFLADADLVVKRVVSATGVETTLALTTDYTVTGAGDEAGGEVTLLVAPTSAQEVVIYRDPARTQLTDYGSNDKFPAASHERALDKLTMIAQRLRELVDRSFRLPDGYTGSASTEIPAPEADKFLAWDDDGLNLINVTLSDLITIAGSANFVPQTFSGDGSTTAFTLSGNPGGVGNLHVYIAGVRQTPTTDYTVSGTTLTFTSAPPTGTNNILTIRGTTLAVGTADAQNVSFQRSESGAASRDVQSKLREIITPEDFGAVGDGVVSDEVAWTALVAHINLAGNIEVRCNPDAIYAITADKTITGSNIIIDGRGCRFTGGGRFEIDGDPLVDGGEPQVDNVHFRNAGFIAHGAYNATKAPRLNFCRNSSLENLWKEGLTGTAFNIHRSKHCWAKNIKCVGSTSGFGFLMWHSHDCLLDGFYATDLEGEVNLWPLVVQVKGGARNVVRRATVEDCTGAGVADYGFYCRGDDPYTAAPEQGTYPYPTGDWSTAPDTQRETREAKFEDCHVVYSAAFAGTKLLTGFQWQQSRDCIFQRCRTVNAGGFNANRTNGGTERNVAYIDCEVDNGTARGFSALGDDSAEMLAGVKLIRPRVTTTVSEGVYVQYCDRPYIERPHVSGATGIGVRSLTSKDPIIVAPYVTGCGSSGINLTNTATDSLATLRDVVSESNTGDNIDLNQPTFCEGTLEPGSGIGRQSTNGTVTTVESITIVDGAKYEVEVEAVGVVGTTTINKFKVGVAVTAAAGAAALIGTQYDLMTAVNPDALGGVTLDTNAATLRIRLGGKAATTVNWRWYSKFRRVT